MRSIRNILRITCLVATVLALSTALPTSSVASSSEPMGQLTTDLGNGLWHHICSQGDSVTGKVTCRAYNNQQADEATDMKVYYHCPTDNNMDSAFSFIQVDIWAGTADLKCILVEGGVGYNTIDITIEANQTKFVQYVGRAG